MREIVMPDVLPSLLGLEIDVHIFALKKSPVRFEKLTGDFGDILLPKTSTQQYHTVRWEYDAKML